MTDIFHLSFWTDDLEKTRHFYSMLGCVVGRERETWFDLNFFGHQVTIHQARQPQAPIKGVGPSKRTLDHFGVILDKKRWQTLLKDLEALDVQFRVGPKQSNVGEPTEQGKFVVTDPDGIGLEFKYCADVGQSFGHISGKHEH